MIEHTCNKCNKVFTKKDDYVRHLNRKYPCVTMVDSITKLKKEINTNSENEKKETNDKLDAQDKKIEELEKKIEQLILKNSPSTEN